MNKKPMTYFKRIITAGLPAVVLILVSTACGTKTETQAPYKNPKLPVEERVEDLLGRMTLEEKIDQLSGVGFDTRENKRLGIPVLKMSDGPVGVRHGFATAFPAAVGIAAAWNPELTEKIAAVMAEEAVSKGRNYLLGPCVNIHRHPLGGRNFESYGEDPFLAARHAVAFVKGVQGRGILAAVKHFACNNQEWERFRVDVRMDERALREIYLPAFKAAVREADVWTVMAAYNVFRGRHCSENKYLLTDILKKEWGFKGFVVSDWGSTHSTVATALAGQDLEMPFGKYFGEKLLKAVKDGDVSEAVIDDKIRRLMRVRFKAGLFDREYPMDPKIIENDAHKKLALEAAEESIVLLKNKNNLLPLDKTKIKSIAVLGPNAAEARVGGGGSSKVTPLYAVSPLEGLQKALGPGVKINYAHGAPIKADIHPLSAEYMIPSNTSQGEQGLWAEYFDNIELNGQPVLARCDKQINFNWGYDAPHPKLHRVNDENLFSIRWTGALLPPETGVYHFDFINNDGVRLYLDDQLLVDNWKENRVKFNGASVELTAGKRYHLRIEYFFNGGISMVKFGWRIPNRNPLEEAVNLARQSDAAVIFAGLSNRFESESHDRVRMGIPRQDKLIKAVAAVNPNTIVVLNSGSPLLINEWVNDVPAVVQAWYPGQEGGAAVARILLGDINPSGKLPFSYLEKQEHSPAFDGYMQKEPLEVQYKEGLFVGYRYLDQQGIEALFPFGHGLSYTRFEYSQLKIGAAPAGGFTLAVDVRNSGQRAGAETVQVYIKDIESSLERPLKELKGFQKIFLEPGETQTVRIRLKQEAFAFYHSGDKQWVVEPGAFEIWVGSSSADIRLKKKISF